VRHVASGEPFVPGPTSRSLASDRWRQVMADIGDVADLYQLDVGCARLS
jgi:hypothetical protein